MSVERLYTLLELSDETGVSKAELRDLVNCGELAAVRRTPKGKIRIAESVWNAWQASHSTPVKQTPVVVELNPPKRASVKKRTAVDVTELIPKGFKSPFARSA